MHTVHNLPSTAKKKTNREKQNKTKHKIDNIHKFQCKKIEQTNTYQKTHVTSESET